MLHCNFVNSGQFCYNRSVVNMQHAQHMSNSIALHIHPRLIQMRFFPADPFAACFCDPRIVSEILSGLAFGHEDSRPTFSGVTKWRGPNPILFSSMQETANLGTSCCRLRAELLLPSFSETASTPDFIPDQHCDPVSLYGPDWMKTTFASLYDPHHV